MFQVMVVENVDEGQLARASWAFPAYLMLMSLFIVPIAVLGLERMPRGQPRHVRPDPAFGRRGRARWRCWPFWAGFPRPPRW
jgi:hypothetical protein